MDFTPTGLAGDIDGAVGGLPFSDKIKQALHQNFLDTQTGSSFLASAGSFLTGIKRWFEGLVGPLISANSYNAKQVIDKLIDTDSAGTISAVEKATGIPGLAAKIKGICKDGAGDYIGLLGMPTDPSESLSLLRSEGGMHQQIAQVIAQGLFDKYKDKAKNTAELIAVKKTISDIADQYAYTITGFDPSLSDPKAVDEATAVQAYNRFPPTVGIAGMLRTATLYAIGKDDGKGHTLDPDGKPVTGSMIFLNGGPPSFSPDAAQHPQITFGGDAEAFKAANDARDAFITGKAKAPTPQPPAPPKAAPPKVSLNGVTGGQNHNGAPIHNAPAKPAVPNPNAIA